MTLGQRIRAKIDDGKLPTGPATTWAGYGRGGDFCSACDEPILPAQTQYELEDDTGEVAFLFHPSCHRLWVAASRPPRVPGGLDLAS